ncbi:hypothetical protein MNBD_GAMMA09-1301 [hydrothermal vent metagenome]|uniref:Uncharacterized protein n=1 Tax=hydrothermal vent metagenome TaxID=652676 RepID=A0A3B0XLV5_9ZZZZ
MKYSLSLVPSILALLLNGCGGDSGENTPTATVTPSTGVFIDSVVSGLHYQTDSASGDTNVAGEFKYLPGETITFSVGGIALGSAKAASVLSPLDLVPTAQDITDTEVTNIVRLLMTLDSDGDETNGISIAPAVVVAAENLTVNFKSVNFSADAGVIALLNALPVGTMLAGTGDAQLHLSTSLSQWGNLVWGSGAWQAPAP